MSDNITKTKIIETMYHLIAEKGYDKTSIGQIADLIGIKKASVYYYFKSKEDIFLHIVKELYQDDYWDDTELFKKNISANSYKTALISTGENCIDSYFKNQDLRKVYAEIDIQTSRIPELKEFVIAADEKFNQFLLQCMVRGVEVGAFPSDFDTKLNAQILYTILVGIDQAILYDLPIEAKAVWKEIVSKLFARKVLEKS